MLHHFLGLTCYYRKFILLLSSVTKCLYKLLTKETKFQWSPQCQAAFKHLKQALHKECILQYSSMEKPYISFTDTRHYAYSRVLTQAVESPEDLKPVVFMSVSFSEMLQRWYATVKEAHAFYQSVLKFGLYVRGAEYLLCCTHKSLELFLSKGIKIPKSIGGLWNYQTIMLHLYISKPTTMY